MAVFFGMGSEQKRLVNNAERQGSKNDLASGQMTKTILFFGNSLTAGYGLRAEETFPSLIQEKITSLRLPYKAVNAGVNGDTTAAGNSRINWFLNEPIDVFVLELGVNDGLRGIPVEVIRGNLQDIIDKVKARYPNVRLVLAGMQLPPYFSHKYINDFRNLFPELATKNNMALIPFLLEGVGGVRALNLPDGAHPTAAGQRIVAENVWEVLKDVLN